MKKFLLLSVLWLCAVVVQSQITYFPETANSWVQSKDEKARLYSVELRSGQTIVTIELVPTKDRGRMNYWTSRNTIVQAANGKVVLPIRGFVRTKNGETFYHTEPFEGNWGWSKVKKGQSYRYSMVFDGSIPPGVTDFALRDRGDYSGAHGYQFWNYKIDNPHKGGTVFTSETIIKREIDAYPSDPFVGIYEGFGGNQYKLACVKGKDGEYALLYISDKQQIPWWRVGDAKALLKKSATPGFFKAIWAMGDKSLNEDAYVYFEKGGMKTVVNNEEDAYLKMYPVIDQSGTYTDGGNGEKWSGTGFALLNGYIATNYHVIDGAKSVSVQGINGEFLISYKAEIVASDKVNDLALIRINDSRFRGFGTISYSVKMGIAEVGEEVFVLGYPMTTTMGDEIKLTTGVISAKTGFQGDVALYQISAPIQPGNSGGPLFDNNGNIIGVVNAKHQGAENVGYAIKVSYLRNLIESYTSQSLLPVNNSISNLPLTGKVREAKNFVFKISCSN